MIQEILIHNLKFDPFNPRLPRIYEQQADSDIIEWMLQDASLIDLFSSIANNGYFAGEPIVVVKGEADSYIVVEGNRRLAAVKLLNDPKLASIKHAEIERIILEREVKDIPNSLPCYILKNREEADDYLGFRHVTGVKSWGALEKSKYTFKLFEEYKIQNKGLNDSIYRRLAKKIGSKKAYIQRMIVGYRLFKIIEEARFYNISDLNEETFDFSLLTDAATKYTHLREFLNIDLSAGDELATIDTSRLREITHWLYQKNFENQTRVGESRNISLLNAVVSNDLALKNFRGGKSLEDASRLTSVVEDNFTELIKVAYDNVRDAIQYIALLKDVSITDIDKLKDMNQQIVFMYKSLQNKQNSPELI
jgi:ParB-like nuclease domain